ncbi:protein RFT1 homolog [Condylostylus longicornis]|uniref:protein RFT1 homolog n=1 Tax=Condylostylus longicornis TaxID=2530218 RepID=UPI00244DB40B|nr:protein RFT1 homolog [Condylostylus longicornis]
MKRNILKSSVQHAYFSIIFQILCRIITFGINAFIVRSVGREVLGIMNVRLLLLESTLLFLSREAISRAVLSVSTQHKGRCNWPQIINQVWLTVPICFILSIPCLYIWLAILSPVEDSLWEQYKFGCYSMAISCIVELFAEAPVFVAKVFCFVKLKIAMDTLHIFIRSIVFLTIVFHDKEICIYAFAIAQFCSASFIVVGFYSSMHYYIKNEQANNLDNGDKKRRNLSDFESFPFKNIIEMIPGYLPNDEKKFNTELQVLTLSFVKQGVFKQILTEGEKYVMSISPVLSFSEQATYDVVNNLGSLAARFIFRPIEDSSYFYFTQTISRDLSLIRQDKEKVNETGFVLKTLFMIITSVGIIIFVFGQYYSGIALYLYGGADFVSDGLSEKLLRWHCLAILFLAVNGISEAFMFATNSSIEIDKYNVYMAGFSIVFLLSSYLLTNMLGPVGFIVANCANMFCRICYSVRYINKKFEPVSIRPFDGFYPGKMFSCSLIVAVVICFMFQVSHTTNILLNLFVGACCFIICLFSWTLENKTLIKTLLNKYAEKRELQRRMSMTTETKDNHHTKVE